MHSHIEVQDTLSHHRADMRDYVFNYDQPEQAREEQPRWDAIYPPRVQRRDVENACIWTNRGTVLRERQ
jgi:hypothetical protein